MSPMDCIQYILKEDQDLIPALKPWKLYNKNTYPIKIGCYSAGKCQKTDRKQSICSRPTEL